MRTYLVLAALLSGSLAAAQRGPAPDHAALVAARDATEQQLEAIAIIDRKVMVPMRDGKRMSADVYRPKDTSQTYPIIFVRTPYNFNYWDVRNGTYASMTAQLEAVRRGYIYVEMNERGHFQSEGNYDILGPPLTDGDDAIAWMTSQPWSDHKVGTTGCSSTAEWQLAVVAQNPPGFAAFNVQSFGAGVGRVGPYYEQGNWYRGGAVQLLFTTWIYGEQNQVRPMFPAGTTQADRVAGSKLFDLAPQMPPVDWSKALWHLPEQDILKAVGAPRGIFADAMPVPTGGRMIERAPNDPAWYRGGLWHDNMPVKLPGLWFMTWYDVSMGPNLAAYNYVRRTAPAAIGNEQYMVIAPTLHCGYTRATENTVVGERSMGDARFDYDALMYGFFDKFLKGADSPRLDAEAKVHYFNMGENKWHDSETWPPAGAHAETLYLTSAGRANTLNGDGGLTAAAAGADHPDNFTYDPMNPVPSHGGNVCCEGNALAGGALDQRVVEARPDVLVYTSAPFAEGKQVSGPIDATLYVSSDAKDTDFTIKVMDVYPDGTAYNLDETIQRLRYRNGYDKPLVWMEPGKVAKFSFQPMNTSNYFAPGHRLRIEISSSNFPRFDRNLNTGGNNYDEAKGVAAHNSVHHSSEYPSSVTLSVVPNR